jgi:SulP family sulfate permease
MSAPMFTAVRNTAGSLPLHSWFDDTLTYLQRPVEILGRYRRQNLVPDLTAGLTVAVILLPQAIAYASVAELPPQTGLYAAIVAAIVGALWGSSNHLQTGPTNTASLLVLSTLLAVARPGTPEYLAAGGVMAIMVGVARLLMGLAHLGVLVNFVSDSVVIGFTAGAGILISVNQLRYLLGVSVPSSPTLYVTAADTLRHLPQTNQPSLLLGLATIAVMIAVKRFRPKWPNSMIALVVASAAVAVFGLDQQGVAVMGQLPRSLPPLAQLPLLDLELIGQISTGALAVAAIGLVEAMSIARSVATQSGQRLSSNQEFVGQGLANIAAGLFSGYTCSGSFIRTAVNHETGARSPLASAFSGLWVLAAVLLFAPLTAYLPRSALAGVLLVTAYGMVDQREMGRIWHASFGDSAIMVATLLATLLLPLQFAVLAGMIVSFARYIVKTSMPAVYPVVPDENFQHFVLQEDQPVCPQLGVITISGSLYFGAVNHIEDTIRANLEKHPGQRYLLLHMQAVDHCDVSGIHMLESVVRLYRQRKGDVYLTGVRRAVRVQMESIGFDRYLGRDRFLSREDAVSHLFHKALDPSVCIYECDVRVFAECQALPKYDYGLPAAVHAVLAEHSQHLCLPSELRIQLEQMEPARELVLLDVREPREYESGHIPQAQLLPLRLIPKKGQTLPLDCQIVLVCRTGRRSRLAAHILQDMGYTQVINLQGGMLAWEAAGYPVAVE